MLWIEEELHYIFVSMKFFRNSADTIEKRDGKLRKISAHARTPKTSAKFCSILPTPNLVGV